MLNVNCFVSSGLLDESSFNLTEDILTKLMAMPNVSLGRISIRKGIISKAKPVNSCVSLVIAYGELESSVFLANAYAIEISGV